MWHILTSIYLELEGIAFATVSISWNDTASVYRVGAEGQWPENWLHPLSDNQKDAKTAWIMYSAKVGVLLERGLVPKYKEVNDGLRR